MPFSDRYEQATDKAAVEIEGGVVQVQRDGEVWLFWASDFAEAREQFQGQAPLSGRGEDVEAEALADLLAAVGGPVVAFRGVDRGSLAKRRELARAALKVGLLPAELRAWTVAA